MASCSQRARNQYFQKSSRSSRTTKQAKKPNQNGRRERGRHQPNTGSWVDDDNGVSSRAQAATATCFVSSYRSPSWILAAQLMQLPRLHSYDKFIPDISAWFGLVRQTSSVTKLRFW